MALGINHHSPLIYCRLPDVPHAEAGNQSPLPFDILTMKLTLSRPGWESITTPL